MMFAVMIALFFFWKSEEYFQNLHVLSCKARGTCIHHSAVEGLV